MASNPSSAQPGLAALAGLLLLDQVPAAHEWTGIVIVALANATAVTTTDHRRANHTRRSPASVADTSALPTLSPPPAP